MASNSKGRTKQGGERMHRETEDPGQKKHRETDKQMKPFEETKKTNPRTKTQNKNE